MAYYPPKQLGPPAQRDQYAQARRDKSVIPETGIHLLLGALSSCQKSPTELREKGNFKDTPRILSKGRLPPPFLISPAPEAKSHESKALAWASPALNSAPCQCHTPLSSVTPESIRAGKAPKDFLVQPFVSHTRRLTEVKRLVHADSKWQTEPRFTSGSLTFPLPCS